MTVIVAYMRASVKRFQPVAEPRELVPEPRELAPEPACELALAGSYVGLLPTC